MTLSFSHRKENKSLLFSSSLVLKSVFYLSRGHQRMNGSSTETSVTTPQSQKLVCCGLPPWGRHTLQDNTSGRKYPDAKNPDMKNNQISFFINTGIELGSFRRRWVVWASLMQGRGRWYIHRFLKKRHRYFICLISANKIFRNGAPVASLDHAALSFYQKQRGRGCCGFIECQHYWRLCVPF